MNKQQLTNLFARCNPNSSLCAVAQEARERIEASQNVRIVTGAPQPSVDLLRIYTARLKRKRDRNEQIPGLEETVQLFAECKGQLRGNYAEINTGLIYFWVDDSGNLAGCIL